MMEMMAKVFVYVVKYLYASMIRLCGMRFAKKWLYLQVYSSAILLCCSGYFLVQMLYCQSQLDLIGQFQLDLYACLDICPNYPTSLLPFDAFVCCTDSMYSECVEKYSCLEWMVNVFAEKENTNGLTMACLIVAVPLFILLHVIVNICMKRRRRNEEQNRRAARRVVDRSGMPTLQSFLHNDQENQCSICLEGFANEKAILLICGHLFHNQCIRQWGSRKKSCPVCRNEQ